ncbi:hypothetical protein WME98_20460 [Sorangium sp. So ce296]|uniref:hypothetical protein n=1 Tax=Sorangium sp. So ce296 TaxID=3133296 RepID=UPI003F629249
MSQLPNGWAWATLQEIAAHEPNAMTDGPFGSNLKTSDYVDRGVRVIRLGNLGIGKFLENDRAYISTSKYETLKKHGAFAGDLVIAALAEPVGRCIELPVDLGKAVVKADCVRLKVHSEIERKYVMYCLNSPDGRKRAEDAAHGIGRLRINMADMRALRVPLAPASEQRRIVAKIETLTSQSRRAKEALDAIPPLLERFRKSVLAAAFRGDLTADWREKNPDVEPAEELLKRIRAERRRRWEEAELAKMRAKGKVPGDDRWKERYEEPEPVDPNELPELPEGWCWATIDTVGHLLLGRRRAPEYVEGEDGRVLRPYVRVANVKRDRLDLSDVLQMPFNDDELSLYRLEPGDIILSEGQSPELVGQSAVYEGGHENLCIQATVHRFRPYKSGTSTEYAQLVFLHHLHTEVFRSAASLTTNIAHLTSERLKPLPFPLAPLKEQTSISTRVRQALERSKNIESIAKQATQRLSLQEKSLLAKAFRGELVPQDPNDEPAYVLLERLRAEAAQNSRTANGASRSPKAAAREPSKSNSSANGRKVGARPR